MADGRTKIKKARLALPIVTFGIGDRDGKKEAGAIVISNVSLSDTAVFQRAIDVEKTKREGALLLTCNHRNDYVRGDLLGWMFDR